MTCATVVTAKPCKGPSLRLFFEGFTAQCIAEQLAACANTPPMPQDIVTHDWAQIARTGGGSGCGRRHGKAWGRFARQFNAP